MRLLNLRTQPAIKADAFKAVAIALAVILSCQSASVVAVQQSDSEQSNQSSTDHSAQVSKASKGSANTQLIAELINKLGSDSYATRIRARDQLKAFGLEAFDALYEAQKHDDSEIQSAARYLQTSLQVNWSNETDPKQVREILYEYGAQNATDRLARIELLGRLPDFMGVEALARLSRFDREVELSRRAAMLVLKQPIPDERNKRLMLAEKIQSVIDDNSRDSVNWLRTYAADLVDGRYEPTRWQDVVITQRQKVDIGVDPDITAESVLKLIKVIATRAIEEDERQSALDLVLANLDLISPATKDLADQSDWAITHELYPFVTELYQRHRHAFAMNAELLYSAAQAFRDNGQVEEGNQLAMDAFKVSPLPDVTVEELDDADVAPSEEEKAKLGLTDHQLEDVASSHLAVALQLKMRGQFDWAEREYRAIVGNCGIETYVGIRSRINLSSLFAEQLNHADAVKTLAPLVDRIERDQEFVKKLLAYDMLSQFIQSEYHFRTAMALLAKEPVSQEDLEQAKVKLQTAYNQDSGNIDILIQMFRIDDPNDQDWQTQVARQLKQHIQASSEAIRRYEASKRAMSDDRYRMLLGEKYNEYAWLVANTKGDYQQALRYSQQSLKLSSDDNPTQRAARLDTCARCYFAIGDIENAIVTQKEALQYDRNSLPMIRQLAEFEAALN
ncbi:hypothetical protein LOC67_21940 [Stieleria sp. JC731]|uniref:hypothetical protein n=1 Tax=Pirellulaceae TaxID=2691357 RepID=UPI001E3BAFA2|nr:hypothetical protein [Stieleria sp. JC731]MCC9603219.1 hypothetical protein [Stieleria sp. JC731]